jgi:hypothetical protein
MSRIGAYLEQNGAKTSKKLNEFLKKDKALENQQISR